MEHKELAELEQQIQKKNKQLTDLKNKKKGLEEKYILPDLIKKHQGKYWVFKNSDGKNEWDLIYYVTKVKGMYHCEAISIQLTPCNELKIKQENMLPLSMLEEEITTKEFRDKFIVINEYYLETLKRMPI